MSIYRVKETHKGRDGSLTEGMERRYVRKFDVYTTSKMDGPIEVMFAVDPFTGIAIPRLYTSYRSFGVTELDRYAICRSITPTQDEEDWQVWRVVCEYRTNGQTVQGTPESGHDPSGGGNAGDNLDVEPPTVEWGAWTKEEAQMKAVKLPLFGGFVDFIVPITNSAGQPFDPVPMKEVGSVTLTVERNEYIYDWFKMAKYAFKTNSDTFLSTADTGLWLCKPITAKKVYKGPFSYYRVRYEFHCNRTRDDRNVLLGWNHLFLDQGYSTISVLGIRVPVMHFGQPTSQPVPLDGAGKELSKADLENPAKGPVYLKYRKYRSVPFAPLKIVT